MKIILSLLLIILLSSCATAEEKQKLALKDGDRKLLEYNAAYIPSPVKEKPYYGRSGFIHPVYTPEGKIVTDPFPKDHLHQHALMFAWTSSIIDGKKVDFWNSHRKAGRIEHVETITESADKIVVKLRHVNISKGKDEVVLEETWEITRIPHKGLNIFDLKSTQNVVNRESLKIQKYHYGAMCIRGAGAWLKDMNVTTSEGKDRKAANHSRPNWVAMSGEVDGDMCGIAAMSHPANFRAPQPVRVHPEKPYFCFAPMVLGDFEISKGKPYVSRFRFVAFDGSAQSHALNEVYKDFSKK